MVTKFLRRKRDSFTLIEILLVCAILVILAVISLYAIDGAIKKSHYVRWRGYAHQMRSDDRLLVYYTFEDGNGSTTVKNQSVGSGLPWAYISSSGDASFNGALKISVDESRWPGLKGGVRFDSSTAVLRALDFAWPMDTSSSPVTVLMWANIKDPGDINVNGVFFTIGNASSPNLCEAIFSWSGSKLLYWDYGAHLVNGRITCDYRPYFNRWTHLALVSEGKGGAFKAIYLNGKPINSDTTPMNSPNDGPAPANALALSTIYLGYGVGSYSKGAVDEFAAFARVLSPAEIEKHYRSGKP